MNKSRMVNQPAKGKRVARPCGLVHHAASSTERRGLGGIIPPGERLKKKGNLIAELEVFQSKNYHVVLLLGFFFVFLVESDHKNKKMD